MPAGLLIGAMVMQGVSMYQQNKAAKASAALAEKTAQYNAEVDLSDAKQIELDADANEISARKDAAVYSSRQRAAYAASGVLNTGSPLAVQASTAANLEQRIQQQRLDAGREVSKRQSAAQAGILYGEATAKGIKTNNQAALLAGGAKLLSMGAGGFSNGAFSWGGAGATDSASSMLSAGAPAGVASRFGT
jgi:hypothetical protein